MDSPPFPFLSGEMSERHILSCWNLSEHLSPLRVGILYNIASQRHDLCCHLPAKWFQVWIPWGVRGFLWGICMYTGFLQQSTDMHLGDIWTATLMSLWRIVCILDSFRHTSTSSLYPTVGHHTVKQRILVAKLDAALCLPLISSAQSFKILGSLWTKIWKKLRNNIQHC